jgi:CBS domain-containing protein
MRVEDVMTQDVKTVGPESSLKDVAGLLSEHRIGGMPVVDGHGRPLGVISNADIVMKKRAELPAGRLRRLFRRDQGTTVLSKVTARTAGEAMGAPPITIDPSMPLSMVAELMLAHGVNRLPVVQRDRVVGIVTRQDLVRAFARGDTEIEREIREDALAGLAWPEELELSVHDGDVTLRGRVDSVFDAETLPVQVRRIMGVVSVDSELSGWDPRGKGRVAVAAHL